MFDSNIIGLITLVVIKAFMEPIDWYPITQLSHSIPFEEWVPVDFIYWHLIFEGITVTLQG